MKINTRHVNIILARQCKSFSALRTAVSAQTLMRIKRGKVVTAATLGKIAKALNVDPTEIIETEE